MPQEWVAGWMVILVERGFTTFCGHGLTISLFFAQRGKSPPPPSSSPPPWCCVCGWSNSRSEHVKLHVFLAALSLFEFLLVLVSLFLCLPRSSCYHSSFLFPFPSFFHPCMVSLPPTPRFSLDTSDQGVWIFQCLVLPVSVSLLVCQPQ